VTPKCGLRAPKAPSLSAAKLHKLWLVLKKPKFDEIEARYSATGELPTENTPEATAYRARLLESDARKAEAVAELYPDMDPLQRIRSYLLRGSLDLAREILFSLESSQQSPEMAIEIYLEQTRLNAFEGKWLMALQLSQTALDLKPTGISSLTLRQIRAVAFMELGEFVKAQREIDSAISLAKLFPRTGLSLFVAATQIKVLAFQGQQAQAQSKLERAWADLKSGPEFNLDNTLTLLRAEIETIRSQQKPVAELSYAALTMARVTGDRLYEALSTLELIAGLSDRMKSTWAASLTSANQSFARIRTLTEEINQDAIPSSSATSISRSIVDGRFARSPDNIDETLKIILLRREIAIDCRELKVENLKLSKQIQKALLALAHGSVEKEDFFRAVWGDQKFVPDLHDDVIRSLLHRIRKSHGIEILTREREIRAPGYLLVDV
jgi:tetratricopeptide (TPR) repeat protein